MYMYIALIKSINNVALALSLDSSQIIVTLKSWDMSGDKANMHLY